MRTAVYPGTFDPMTNGHLDLVQRASQIFDQVIIAIARNDKKTPLFSFDERTELAQESLSGLTNIEVDGFDGLLVDYAKSKQAGVIIRGLRAVSDFEFEFQMALANRKLDNQVETLFLMPNEDYTFISSSIVKDIARHGGDCDQFVPDAVARALRKKFAQSKE